MVVGWTNGIWMKNINESKLLHKSIQNQTTTIYEYIYTYKYLQTMYL